MVAGIKILGAVGGCEFCNQMNGRIVSLEEAIADEKLRPPFDECTNDACTCTYTEVLVPLDELLKRG